MLSHLVRGLSSLEALYKLCHYILYSSPQRANKEVELGSINSQVSNPGKREGGCGEEVRGDF